MGTVRSDGELYIQRIEMYIDMKICIYRDTFEGYFKSAAEDVNQYLSRPDFVECKQRFSVLFSPSHFLLE